MSTVNIEMDVFTAASVRQILFEEQKHLYTRSQVYSTTDHFCS